MSKKVNLNTKICFEITVGVFNLKIWNQFVYYFVQLHIINIIKLK